MRKSLLLKKCFLITGVTLAVLLLAVFIACETPVEEHPELEPTPEVNLRRYMKRGVSYNFLFPRQNPVPREDMELLSPGVRWFYNWSLNTTTQVEELAREFDLVFIPQRHNERGGGGWPHGGVNGTIENLRGFIERNPETRWIMAHNEPMLTNEANLTPMEAAAAWPNIMTVASELDLKVLSPALTFGNIGSREGVEAWNTPNGWFDAFLEQPGVDLDDIDIVRVHNYMGWINPLRDYIEGFRRYERPVWVTEFAAWGNPLQPTDEEWQMRFMSESVMYFELEPLVEKYFWFIPKGGDINYTPRDNLRPPFNKLLTQDIPPRLTRLGVVYVYMPHININRQNWIPAGQRMTAEHLTNANTTTSPNQFVHFRPTTDTAEGSAVLDIHNFSANRWVEFQVEASAGARSLTIRNTALQATVLDVYANDNFVTTVNLTQSDEWRTTEVPLTLSASWYTIRLSVRSGDFALNWLRLN